MAWANITCAAMASGAPCGGVLCSGVESLPAAEAGRKAGTTPAMCHAEQHCHARKPAASQQPPVTCQRARAPIGTTGPLVNNRQLKGRRSAAARREGREGHRRGPHDGRQSWPCRGGCAVTGGPVRAHATPHRIASGEYGSAGATGPGAAGVGVTCATTTDERMQESPPDPLHNKAV